MGGYAIKKYSDEEMKDFMAKYPEAPTPVGFWELKDGDIRIGFYRTRVEAETTVKNLELNGKITDRFEEWADRTADRYKMMPSEVEKIVKAHLI